MAETQLITYTARFNTRGKVTRLGKFNPEPPWAWDVPVQWWAYDNDRLDGRGDAKLAKAQVRTLAHTAEQARRNVHQEWGHYATVGTPTEATTDETIY
jgi:hypothetical protein